jgi:hypothetical protein
MCQTEESTPASQHPAVKSNSQDNMDINSDTESDSSSDDASYTNSNIIPQRHLPTIIIKDPKDENGDNIIKLIKPGIQVCAFEYNIRPPVGIYYRVNKDHNMVKVEIEAGLMYQADHACTLYKVGLPYYNSGAG